MTLDEIFAEWEVDSVISPTNLDGESLNIPKLHNKYFKILSGERLKLKKAEAEHSILTKLRGDYYLGTLDHEVYRERGWTPIRNRVIKADLSSYLAADEELIQSTFKIAMMKEKTEVLTDIVKMISVRNFQIKNAIDYRRFQAGM